MHLRSPYLPERSAPFFFLALYFLNILKLFHVFFFFLLNQKSPRYSGLFGELMLMLRFISQTSLLTTLVCIKCRHSNMSSTISFLASILP